MVYVISIYMASWCPYQINSNIVKVWWPFLTTSHQNQAIDHYKWHYVGHCSSHTIVQSAQNHQCKPSPLSVGMGSMNNATSNPSTNRWLWYQPHTLSPCVYLSDATVGAAFPHLKTMAAILLQRLTILSGASCSPYPPSSPKNRSHGG